MTYNVIFDVPAPIEMYDATHAAVRETLGNTDVGLVLHVARATDAGFEIVVAAKIPGAEGMEAPPGRAFEVRGLIVAGNDDLTI